MKILSSLPFSDQPTHVDSPAGRVELYAYQIGVTISLVLKNGTVSRPFPAVLDTGLNQSCALTQFHLNQWTGLKLAQLPLWGLTMVGGQKVPLHEAGVSLYPNIRGQRALSGRTPFARQVNTGIMIFPGPYPRLPLLGTRALVDSQLRLVVEGSRKTVDLSTIGVLSRFGIG